MSYLKSRPAAMDGEVRCVVALKAGVSDNPVSCGDTSVLELLCGPQGRAILACGDTSTLELLCGPQGRAILA